VNKPCPYNGDFKCNDTGNCLRSTAVCDGFPHCTNGADELNCGKICIIIIMIGAKLYK